MSYMQYPPGPSSKRKCPSPLPRPTQSKVRGLSVVLALVVITGCNDDAVPTGVVRGYSPTAPSLSTTGPGTTSDTIWLPVTDTMAVPADTTWLRTGKDDYAPGQYVDIVGAGWQPTETVTLVFEEESRTHPAVTVRATADSVGFVSDQSFLLSEYHLGERFLVTATGQTSGRTAAAVFTDYLGGAAAPTPSSGPTTGGTRVVIPVYWSFDTYMNGGYYVRVRFGNSGWVTATPECGPAHPSQCGAFGSNYRGYGISVQTPAYASPGLVDIEISDTECRVEWRWEWRWEWRGSWPNRYQYWYQYWYTVNVCWSTTRFLPRAFTYLSPNQAPTITMPGSFGGAEGSVVQFAGISATDLDNDNLAYTLDFGDGTTAATGTLTGTGGGAALDPATIAKHTYGDNGVYTLQLTVSDGKASVVQRTAQVTVANVAPTITAISLPTAPVPVGTAVSANAVFGDAGFLDTHTAKFQWDWDPVAESSLGSTISGSVTESNGAGSATAGNFYAAPGVYTVRVTVEDDDHTALGNGAATRVTTIDVPAYIVVYDPTAGFVTGGGWIESPPGACSWNGCATNGSTIGKANFGFVSKYQKGATTPTGNTEFQFKAGNLNFQSSSYAWLVVSGARGQYKGEGTINGAGRYGFLLTAVDGHISGGGGTDKFRIKLWDVESGAVVYDNQLGETDDSGAATSLGGGSIVIRAR
jgi:hypothetical protein